MKGTTWVGKVTSRMRGPVGENRGSPAGGWATWLSRVPTQNHILKKPVFGALNYRTCSIQSLQTPIPPFSFPQNSTIHWLKSCRKKENKGWILLYNNLVSVGLHPPWKDCGCGQGLKPEVKNYRLRTPQTHLFGPLQSVSRVGMQYF